MTRKRMHEHIVEQAAASPQIRENTAEELQAMIQERIHERIVAPSFPRNAVIGSGTKCKLCRDWSCLKRGWHGHVKGEDEF